jgi:mercuric ion transport protein
MSQSKAEIAPAPVGGNTGGSSGKKSGSLAVAGVAGVLASACCIGPLVLASIGLGSIAAGVAAAFEPLRPVFIVIALAALAFAGWKIYRRCPVAACEPGTTCALPQADRTYRTLFWVIALIVLALLTFPYYIAFFY